MKFTKRVYGFAAVKAINSNYNADFSGQPRTLPNGQAYATDKAFKYTVRNYIKDVYGSEQKVFFIKRLNEKLNPISLNEAYKKEFGDFPKVKEKKKDVVDKIQVLNNLLSCIDVRWFGATFAGETNISIHGTTQINHGVNLWNENNIYAEQITSPFSNKSDDPDAEKGMTTIGRQSKLEEGHYVHHFSINPMNLTELGENVSQLSTGDMNLLKEAMRRGATYHDSASKAGTENELLFWVELKEGSKLVLPNFTPFVKVVEAEGGKRSFDLAEVAELLGKYSKDIESVEVAVNAQVTELAGAAADWKIIEL